jgi:hypothetical protein
MVLRDLYYFKSPFIKQSDDKNMTAAGVILAEKVNPRFFLPKNPLRGGEGI